MCFSTPKRILKKVNTTIDSEVFESKKIKSCETEDSTKKTAQKTEISEEDIEFIMANTDFNRDSVLRWFCAFKKQCPDCKLDRPNFINFYRNLIPGNSEVKEEFAEAVFQAFDFDNNGYVDFGKYSSFILKKLYNILNIFENKVFCFHLKLFYFRILYLETQKFIFN